MGIDSLLKFLKPITQKQHISSFKNQRAGIDIMSWIYRGCYSCNFELAQNVQSIKYLYYLLEMIEILSYYNIKPIFIFDGKNIQMKNQTNQKRIKQKQQNKAKAQECLKQGNLQDARKYFSRCIFIDQKIISTTMNVMHSKNISFYVAPYQADCQIAKLKKLGIIDVAISQDSDLIAYGVNTILKLNQNGDCDYIDVNKWAPRDVDQVYLKQYLAMGYVNRIEACILAGSDYNPSVKGIGIKKAVKHMYRQAKMQNVINKLKSEKTYNSRIPQNYQKLIQKAKMIFLFATVYNPFKKQLEYLNPDMLQQYKPSDITQEQLLTIVGQHYSQYIEKQVYLGKTRAKDLQTRQIKAVNIRQMFSINRENMILHESTNRNRKIQQMKLKDKRQEQIKNGLIQDTNNMKSNHSSSKASIKQISSTLSKTQLTQQQKQKKKLQRKNRIIKLQDVMNSVVQMCQMQQEQQKQKQFQQLEKSNPLSFINKKLVQVSQQLLSSNKNSRNKKQMKENNEEDSSSSSSDISSQSEFQYKYKSNQIQKQKSDQKSNQKEMKNIYHFDDDQQKSQIEKESQSESVDLAFLNPFAKQLRDNQKTATKENSKSSKK